MGLYAKINNHHVVEQVIVAEAELIQSLDGIWVETFDNDPFQRYAGIGDGWNGSGFLPRPFQSSSWDSVAKKWQTPAALGIVGNSSPIITADGVDFVTVYIVGATPNSTQEITVNAEPFSINIGVDGYGEFELSSDVSGLLLVEWDGLSLEVAAL